MRNIIIVILATLGLGAHSGNAQSLTLHSGDHVTVDSTGTHGVINNRRVNNMITSYISSGNVSGVDNDAIQVNGTATFTLGAGGAITGGPNGIALEVLDGGKVTISGGTISCKPSSAPLTGAGAALSAGGACLVKISGGTITGGQYGPAVAVEESGMVIISSGAITGKYGPALAPEGNGIVTVTGGTITTGRLSLGMIAGGGNGTINLFSLGKPFLVNHIAMNNTSLAANSGGAISGILADGHPVNTKFMNFGHINLNVSKPPIITPRR